MVVPRGRSLVTSVPSFFLKSHLQRFFSTGPSCWESSPGPLPTGRSSCFPVIYLGYVAALILWPGHLAPHRCPQSTLWERGTLLYARSLGELPAWEGRRVPQG